MGIMNTIFGNVSEMDIASLQKYSQAYKELLMKFGKKSTKKR